MCIFRQQEEYASAIKAELKTEKENSEKLQQEVSTVHVSTKCMLID